MKHVGVGIVGAGFRGLNTLGGRMAETVRETGLLVTAICDRRPDRLREARDQVAAGFAAQGVRVEPALYTDHDELVRDPAVDLVQVTTPQCAHRDPAVAALRAGKRLYVDKPIAHTLADAIDIVEEAARQEAQVLMGFTRRYELPWRRAFDMVREGVIGDLHMILLRDVIPFHVYFHRWHRRMEWSGGALNDKTSHHFDVLNWFAEAPAEQISAFGGRRVFHADADAPVRCRECDRECPYRVGPTRGKRVSQEEAEITGDSWAQATEEFSRVDNCVYLPGADIKDHAVIQVRYGNGIVGSLFISFFGPRAEDQETMELVGTTGRIRLIRHTGKLDVVSEYGKTHETIDCKKEDFGSSHFGADLELVREMRRFHDGAPPLVSAAEGYEATRMVMAAHRAIDEGVGTVAMADMPCPEA